MSTLEWIDHIHHAVRYSHIAAGFVGLILFWVPIFAAKGSRLHVRCGRIFTYAAYYVGATGFASSVWALAHPASFIGPEWLEMSDAERPYLTERLRFLFSILGFLSLAILSGVLFGVRVIRTRRDHSLLASKLLVGSLVAFGVWSAGLTLFGAANVALMYAGRHLLPVEAAGRYSIPIVLGLVGVLGTWGDLQYLKKPRPTPMAWWYKHMENMLGAGIGFHTAFLVFGALRFLPIQLEGAWQLAPWLLPSIIGIPAIHWWIRYYKRRFGEVESSNAPRDPTPMVPAGST